MEMQGIPDSQKPKTEPDLIDPKRLIEELSIEDFNRYSDEYYKKLPAAEIQMGKPFSMPNHTPQLLVRLGLMLESLRLAPGMKVLDFGAGTCWISKSIWQMGCSVVAVDVSEEALRLGRRLFEDYPIPNIPLASWDTRLFDGIRIPAEDEEIDRVICFDAFHHVPNQNEIIQEFYRVLRNGGTIVFNEPTGPHSVTAESQREMREFNVLENDLEMEDLASQLQRAGFEEPVFKVAASPDYVLNYSEWRGCISGKTPESMRDSIADFQRNSGIFYFQKGKPMNDSRYASSGLAHKLVCDHRRISLKASEHKNVHVTVRNTGESRWLAKNENFIGVMNIASRLLDYGSKEILKDNTRFPIPVELEPGDEFEADVPLHVDTPGKYWLKLDIVSERVCWLEDLGSEPLWIEAEVS